MTIFSEDVSKRVQNTFQRLVEEEVANFYKEMEEVLSLETVWEWVTADQLRVGDLIVMELKRDRVTPLRTAPVTRIVTTDCCNKWRNHRHITIAGRNAACYFDKGELRRMR